MHKNYDVTLAESSTQELWASQDVGNPDAPGKPPKSGNSFSIIMPPPNANDPLHVGHAMFVTVEDVFVRFHRMLGDDTVWVPGTDHAGIETQYVFEKKLQKQGKSRFQFDRKTLYTMIWEYVKENSDVAVSQIKRLGASADWSRFCFTLDPDVVANVQKTFFKLHEDNLVYRDTKLVNYCTKCGTSYSELEVLHVEKVDPLYYIQYGPFEVATVRPETKFGDVALAVHPDDSRYKKYIGTTITFSDLNGETTLPIIADELVDPAFGTGVLKVTPAHDHIDFTIGKRHNLPFPQVINTQGKLTAVANTFEGLSVLEARMKVAEALKAKQLLSREPNFNYTHTVGTCYRCGRTLEPLPLPQFFIKVKAPHNNLTTRALHSLDEGETIIHGAGREKILRNWLEILQDWNISRQIVWGIRIPVWYNTQDYESEIIVGYINSNGQYTSSPLSEALQQTTLTDIEKYLQQVIAGPTVPYVLSEQKPTQPGAWLPETDTFDTWFSSGQWPVLTLQKNQKDFKRFYPTSIMETAYDILPFWVMRMMMLGKFSTNTTPFKHVYLHGLVRDSKGKKMSKSKGNVVNPLEIVEKYGADALRWALIVRSTPGQDKSVGESDFIAGRNLLNKLWNASRYVLLQHQTEQDSNLQNAQSTTQTKEFEKKLHTITQRVTTQLSQLKPGLAAEETFNEFWHWYCDDCIEQQKNGKLPLWCLDEGLVAFLKLFHPFIPHVTEYIWQELYSVKLVTSPTLALTQWSNHA